MPAGLWASDPRSSHLHLERVETAADAVHGADDPTVVDEDVVDLHGAGPRPRGRRGDVERDLLRPEWIRQVEGAHPAVEEAADDDRLGHPGARRRSVLVQVVGAVAAAAS